MPLVSVVFVELAVKVIKKYICHFIDGFPSWNAEV